VCRNIVAHLSKDLDNTTHPGLNGTQFYHTSGSLLTYSGDLADNYLGDGSVQDSSNSGKDNPWWNALNEHVKGIVAVISGHGERLLGRFSTSMSCFLPTDLVSRPLLPTVITFSLFNFGSLSNSHYLSVIIIPIF
jgi:hypothetical protein